MKNRPGKNLAVYVNSTPTVYSSCGISPHKKIVLGSLILVVRMLLGTVTPAQFIKNKRGSKNCFLFIYSFTLFNNDGYKICAN